MCIDITMSSGSTDPAASGMAQRVHLDCVMQSPSYWGPRRTDLRDLWIQPQGAVRHTGQFIVTENHLPMRSMSPYARLVDLPGLVLAVRAFDVLPAVKPSLVV